MTIIVRVVQPPPPSIEKAAKNVFQATTAWISAAAPVDFVTSTEVMSGSSKPNSAEVALHDAVDEKSVDSYATENNPRLANAQTTPADRGSQTDAVEDTVWLQCEVTDSGIGIPGEKVEEHQMILLNLFIQSMCLIQLDHYLVCNL